MSKVTLLFVAATAIAVAETALFSDDFKTKLGEGWTWVRENPEAWRTTENGLEIKIEPGNMWGGGNNAKNVLVRELPGVKDAALAATVTVSNKPTSQYEQVNLVAYYDDSNMVKIGLELVDGEICMVMGREEVDKTMTLAKPPIGVTTLQVRLTIRGSKVFGTYRPEAKGDWIEAGNCELPGKGAPKISLQAYQGPKDAEHWAKIKDFEITKTE